MRVLAPLLPLGPLDLGYYSHVVRPFLDRQGQDETLCLLTDGQAIPRMSQALGARSAFILDLLALGLDPHTTVVFCQSDIAHHAELAWMLGTVTPVAQLKKLAYAAAALSCAPGAWVPGAWVPGALAPGAAWVPGAFEGSGESPGLDVGTLSLPLMEAASLLLYAPDQVMRDPNALGLASVVEDIAARFNASYGQRGGALLRTPAWITEGLLIPGYAQIGAPLAIFAPAALIRKRIMGLQTDSTPIHQPKPEPSLVLALLTALAQPEESAELCRTWRSGGVGYGAYKKRLVALFFETFAEARYRREQLEGQDIQAMLQNGALQAQHLAAPRWAQIVEAVGCGHVP